MVSDQEIDNYLINHDSGVASDEAYEISHLFVLIQNKSDDVIAGDRENLEFIRTRVLNGQPFEEAVSSYSDAAVKEDGGYLGWRTRDQLPDLFIRALKTMKPGANSVSEVLQSSNGLHLLKLHAKRGSGKIAKQQFIQHILIQPDGDNNAEESLVIAEDLYQQLQQGESFEKLARIYSHDPQSRDNGGSLGWVTPGAIVPEFQQAAENLPLNTVSKPVRTQYGYHLIRVTDRREADISDDIATNQARQAIFRRKAEEIYGNWFKTVRNQAFVEYIGQ